MSHSKGLARTAASEARKLFDEDEFIQKLMRTTLFRRVPPAELPLPTLEHICAVADVIALPKNRALPIETEDEEKMFLYEILSGYVKIYDRELSKDEKKQGSIKNPPALLAWRIPGELLGDFQFAAPERPLRDHIVATDTCELLKIPYSTVRELANRYPQIYLNIVNNLAVKAINTRIRAQILRLPNIECKMAKLFIELLGERNPDSIINKHFVINGRFYYEDVAAFLGYESHSVHLSIRDLIKCKLIKHYKNNKSGRFEICNLKGLYQYLERELDKAAELSKQRSKRKSGKSVEGFVTTTRNQVVN